MMNKENVVENFYEMVLELLRESKQILQLDVESIKAYGEEVMPIRFLEKLALKRLLVSENEKVKLSKSGADLHNYLNSTELSSDFIKYRKGKLGLDISEKSLIYFYNTCVENFNTIVRKIESVYGTVLA